MFMKTPLVISRTTGPTIRLVCTHFDVFSMLNSNMGMKFNTFNFCEKYEILTLLCAVVRAELWNNNW